MKMNNRQILIILVSVVVIFSVYAYLTRAAQSKNVSGYIILMDQKVSASEYLDSGVKNFSTVIYLPDGVGMENVTVCSFNFPSGVDQRADITKDGKVDIEDLSLIASAFGCGSGQACWNQPFKDQCFFTFSGRLFKDPTRDWKMDQSDIDLASKYYGQNDPYANTIDCDNHEVCRADINQDGEVDGRDIIIASRLFGTYADVCYSYSNIKVKDLDLNGDGGIDGSDIILIARNYDQKATEQRCTTYPLQYIDGKQWGINVSGRGLYYVGVSYYR